MDKKEPIKNCMIINKKMIKSKLQHKKNLENLFSSGIIRGIHQ